MKLFIKLFAGLITLLVLAVVILLTVIDPNDYKEEIQTQVKNTINRDLLINGDISWTFYPQLGFSSGEIELNNLDGFNRKHLVKIDEASLGLDIMPLLKGQIQIGELTLNGFVLNLITDKNGRSNLDNMSSKSAAEAPAPQESTESQEQTSSDGKSDTFTADKIQLAGININNAVIEIQDLTVPSSTKLNISHIRLGEFALGKEADLSVLTDVLVAEMDGHIDLQSKLLVAADFSSIKLNKLLLKTDFSGKTLPNGKVSSVLSSDITYNLNSAAAEINNLQLNVDKIQLKGSASVQTGAVTKVRYALEGNEWDLNPYLNQSGSADSTPESTPESAPGTAPGPQNETPAAEQEPDLSFLNTLDVQGTLKIAGVKADKLVIGEINKTLQIKNGKAEIKPLTAQLYKGLLTVNGMVDDAKGKNKYKVSTNLNNVDLRPLLTDAAQVDILSGTTAFNFAGTGQGLTPTKIKSGLMGSGDFELLDGELYGVNIPQEIRTLKARLSGKPAPTTADVKKTDFASLTGKFSIKKGLVNNQKFLMLSPVMRLDGLGLVDILKETLDYKLSIAPLSKSDAKTEQFDLNGVTIPLLITGTFTEPKFALDMDGALREQLKEKAKQELKRQQEKLKGKSTEELKEEGKKLEDKVKSKFKNLFG
ncbi:AsmA family protein [Psychromonas aquimarina]|uniref:AsmA family protein n=1 Tax=Psychromonas aquimarina TaxID=444919 RepID=UPI0004134287|nr:AsmA family protein [Psychromonas aquimarina]